jgi:hypothetical protein
VEGGGGGVTESRKFCQVCRHSKKVGNPYLRASRGLNLALVWCRLAPPRELLDNGRHQGPGHAVQLWGRLPAPGRCERVRMSPWSAGNCALSPLPRRGSSVHGSSQRAASWPRGRGSRDLLVFVLSVKPSVLWNQYQERAEGFAVFCVVKDFTLKMEAIRSSEALVTTYKIKWFHSTEDHSGHHVRRVGWENVADWLCNLISTNE